MINNLIIFFVAMSMLIHGATLATKYSTRLAENFRLSKYVIGFIIIAFISILPETFISINAAIDGIPSFGLGTLLGSNVADLTLIFAIIILFSKKEINIKSNILKDIEAFSSFLALPLLFGLDGYFSRFEGVVLFVAGCLFYYSIFKKGINASDVVENKKDKYKNILMLLLSMTMLLIGSNFTVSSAVFIADSLSISPLLIGMLIVGLGTTIPELVFSLKAVQKNEDNLAVGDLLGTVLADATIVVGILAFISPFYFPIKIVYVTGIFMLLASIVLLKFMNTEKTISRNEAYLLIIFWLVYVFVESIINL